MSAVIVDACIRCGACEWECPTQAIRPGAEGPVVEESSCTECFGFFGEAQCIVVCPVSAIRTRSESTSELNRRYLEMYPSRAAQDTWIWRATGVTLNGSPPTENGR